MGSDEDYVYQLRRTGAAATYPHIKDVMKLKMGVTRFGRSTDNDYYLDSAKLKNFISRSHAEIHAKKSEDGQYVFVLHNKGLNGTFINDIKMNQFILLQEGDKITFGHTNGFKLEPGQRANQPNSEFEFVFEKVPARFAEADSTSEVRDGNILSSPESDHKKSPKSPKSPSKLKRQSDINSYLSKHSKDSEKTEIKSHDSPFNSMSPDHRSYDLSSPDARYSECSMSPLIPQPPREASTLIISEEEIEEEEHHDTKPDVTATKKKGQGSVMFSSDDDSENEINEIKDIPVKTKGNKRGRKKKSPTTKVPKIKTSPVTRRKLTISPKRQPIRSNSSSQDIDEELPTPGSPSSGSHHSDSEKDPFNFDDSDSDHHDNKKTKKPTKGKQAMGKEKGPRPGPGPGPGRGRGRKAKAAALPKIEKEFPDEKEDEDEEEEEKPPRKRKPTDTFKPPEQVKKKPRSRSSGADNYSELEDGVEWYEEEKCSAEQCKRPKNKRVKWVQCDLCDEWYHTICVGCQYEHVKDNNIEFSCGYCN